MITQFLGAFGDNAILAIIIGQFTFRYQAGTMTEADLGSANAIYSSLLFIPFVLLATLAGFLNDRYAKTTWLLNGHLIKLIGTGLAAVSIVGGDLWQGVGYLIVGIGACVYSPAKYGILPEILPKERLVKANGLLEMLTLVSILGGTMTGALLIDRLPVGVCYTIVASLYAAAFLLTLAMKPTPAHPGIRLGASTGAFAAHLKTLLTTPRLWRNLLGTSLFWICGSVLKMNFQPWGLEVLGYVKNASIALLGLKLAIGVMIGSLLAGRLHRTSDLSWIRRYGLMMGLFILALGWVVAPSAATLVLIAVGVVGGLYLVPLDAALQAETDPAKLGKTIAAQNFIENLAMITGGFFVYVAVGAGLSSQGVFIALALIALGVSILLCFPPMKTAPST